MRVELVKTYWVEAAHETPWGGDDGRLHGHSLRIDVVVSGECDPQLGWLVDYAEITDRFDSLYGALDHRLLNGVEGLADPTVAGLGGWLRDRLSGKLDNLKDVRVSIVGARAFEPRPVDADGAAGLPARVRFGFEAAHALPRLPESHKCRRMHGHSFTVEVGVCDACVVAAPQGGGLTAGLRGVYDCLDHRCLNEIDGLENPTSEQVSRWIWNRLSREGARLRAVVIAETCTARCIYYGE